MKDFCLDTIFTKGAQQVSFQHSYISSNSIFCVALLFVTSQVPMKTEKYLMIARQYHLCIDDILRQQIYLYYQLRSILEINLDDIFVKLHFINVSLNVCK